MVAAESEVDIFLREEVGLTRSVTIDESPSSIIHDANSSTLSCDALVL